MAAHTPPDPSLTERLQAYAVKAAREGKQETSWLNPHEGYEASLCTFIERILDRSVSAEFLESLEHFARRVALLGALNSLSQITLKAMMPGVPDFYQGTEFWDLSMVDPDNRRPVDFRRTRRCSQAGGAAGLASARPRLAKRPHQARLDPAPSQASQRNGGVFATGDYEPLRSQRSHRDQSSRLPAAAAAMP